MAPIIAGRGASGSLAAMTEPVSESTPVTIPEAEVGIDVTLVRSLLAAQHPDLAERPLSIVAEGWDNVTVRCGDDLAIRLPRRQLGAEILDVELRWLPEIAPHLPVRTPAAIRVGEPAEGYPWHWGVVPWIAGVQAAEVPPLPEEARHFGAILRALHDVPLPDDPPHNPFRSEPLSRWVERTSERLGRLEALGLPEGADFHGLRDLYAQGVSAPVDVPRRWIHADIHPRNIITDEGRIVGVIDWGDMAAGDVCTDLAAAWLLFDQEVRDGIWEAYGPTDTTLTRARAWAVAYGAMLFEAGRSGDQRLEAAGRKALLEVVS